MRRPKRGVQLTNEQREELIQLVLRDTLDSSFGDGQEEDMVLHGYSFKGLRNMSDDELISEGDASWVWEDDSLNG